ncbi:alanine/ornithine racemase family PLP-dependent enzyme [Thermosediminibacter oceani]|uniref:Alanine racemase domain protein n=1 Tax=Thermosediminibacter oceani (strain ATCC BAA-1034 / DSM 16646 / JW/IW-1228P) TaxID=555079 RepID=D9RY16_THEOJ|nr:alanine/ornithine racemase family PLP-dependent enzyme [Thermosediminibacter oceani]ADL08240.1 alanine racemase domain protein [Thermosediminibacter oceani DSM 16646]
MTYPRIEINLSLIRENARYIVDLCKRSGIEVMGITKGFCALLPVVRTMVDGGVKKLGDSRIKNIKNMKCSGLEIPIYLIRIPMPSEVEEVVRWADGSFNSEPEVIDLLSEKARALGKIHRVILMVDVGDLREGVMPEDVPEVVGRILEMPGVEFEGLGTNVGCYGGVLPSYENTKILVDLARDIEKRYGVRVKTISGGNTATLKLVENGRIAPGVNQLRIGEGILLGTDPTNGRNVPGTSQATMVLKAEIIEVKVKPSKPIGEIGRDAFGNIPVFEDRGPMKRAIVALGKQDCRIEGLIPLDESIEILGASSDHLLLDVTRAKRDIRVGSVVEFRMSYGAMLSLMTSPYVDKVPV